MVKSLNFSFLAEPEPLCLQLAAQAEQAFAADPVTTLVKLRLLGEAFAKYAAAAAGLVVDDNSAQHTRLLALSRAQVIDAQVAEMFHRLRQQGNAAVHENAGDHREALASLRIARQLAIWFHRTFAPGGANLRPKAFQAPKAAGPDPALSARIQQLEAALAAREAADAAAEGAAEELAELQDALQAAQAEAAEASAQAASWAELSEAYDAELSELQATLQEERGRFEARLAALQRQADAEAQLSALVNASSKASEQLSLTEAETRLLIDQQLRAAGWEADSERLRYADGARPVAGRNLAIAEYKTRSGPADYVLFMGLSPVAVVEAKKQAVDVPSALEQAKRYARDYALGPSQRPAPGAESYAVGGGHSLTGGGTVGAEAAVGYAVGGGHSLTRDGGVGAVGGGAEVGWFAREHAGAVELYKVPFLFSTNGRPYLKQLERSSGVWFLDVRAPGRMPRALTGWYTPGGLGKLLKQDLQASQDKLQEEPTAYLGLRSYQLAAIEAVERAVSQGARRCLLSMATGTGKTKTIIGLLYRLLKAQRFSKVLFLVDRTALGEQALGAFGDMKLEANQRFTEIFEVLDMRAAEPNPTTRVQLATVQGMVQRMQQAEAEGTPLPVDRYDLIVVDESHRGYTLDRELTDTEFELRSPQRYISTYRRVLDHFDAVRVGLTATPAQHTVEIFGRPIYEYSYREAVIDGYLVDHAPPYQLYTQLSKAGIHFDPGEQIQMLIPGGVTELDTLPDQLDFDVADFNAKVISKAFTRVVCEALTEYLDPNGDKKTLIFCVTDAHADDVVLGLKRAFAADGWRIDESAIMKITGRTDKYPEHIRRLKNERLPNIAVTVDLLTTGIDVPKICNLVFLRRVRSRILYEQMLGRATRLADDIDKKVFQIFDCVRLYEALLPTSAMRPVVVQPNVSLAELLQELRDPRAHEPNHPDGSSHADAVLTQVIVRLRHTARRLERLRPAPEAADDLARIAGRPLNALLDHFKQLKAAGVKAELTPQLTMALIALHRAVGGRPTGMVVSEHSDDLVSMERGYGEGTKPEDYLQAFHDYIEHNRNQLDALRVVLTRPRDLTRADLKALQMTLAAQGYTTPNLRAAWRDTTNADIAAHIIGFIRQQALGSPLIPYAQRVQQALQRVLSAHAWTDPQRRWLERIAKQLEADPIVDEETFASGAFDSFGGYKNINKKLGGQLEMVLGELRAAIWDDGDAALGLGAAGGGGGAA